MPILEVKNIKKGFGDTDVLKGVSFSMERGQVLAIIGSSGSGKTTLLRCLNFLETPDEGEIWVNGKLLTGENLVRRPDSSEQAPLRPGFPEFQPVSPVYGAGKCHAGRKAAGAGGTGFQEEQETDTGTD